MGQARSNVPSPALMMRYVAAGIANTIVGLGAIAFLDFAVGLPPSLANALGYAAGLTSAALLNRRWVFNERRVAGATSLRFIAAALAAFALNQAVLAAALACLPHGAGTEAAAQLAAIASYNVTMFLLCNVWVYRVHRAGGA